MKVEVDAFVCVRLYAKEIDECTIGDVRAWLKTVDELGYTDKTVVEECLLSLCVRSENVSPIGCGNHKANEPNYCDILVGTHEC
jgi:hypothetical protein